MNNYFRYKCKSNWITVRKEDDDYYVVNPHYIQLIKLDAVQAAILYSINMEKKTVEDIRKILANNGINDKYIDLFVKKAEKVGIMEM